MTTTIAPKKLGRPTGTASAPDRRKSKPTGLAEIERLPFPEFCEEYLVHTVDKFAGLPFVLEDWQREFMDEALEAPEGGAFTWPSVVLVVPRKNGKTALLAAYALWRLFEDGQPEILLAASSDKQAGRLFNAVVRFVRKNPALGDNVHLREYVGEIARVDGGGTIIRMASDPSTAHGYEPSLVICDELHAWSKPSQRKTWAALVSGDATRDRVQTFTITTAGEANERDTGILGPMIDGNERDGELERDTRWALTISRNRESGTLIWNFSAQTEDPNDVAALKRANPASWISTDYLARKSASPELSDAEVLQLHGCVWAEGLRTWIPAEAWERCYEAGAEIPQDASVYVGVDIALVRDSTAVSVAWKRPEDERIVVETHVWAARAGTVAHEQPHGPVIKVSAIEEHLLALTSRYAVQEVLYDKRYFERSAEDLSDAGLTMVVLEQNSAPMADAYQDWFAGCMEGKVVHGGDKVLTAHVMATAAQKTDRGWRVSKIKQSHKIDGCVASVMAHYGAAHGVVADWGVLT